MPRADLNGRLRVSEIFYSLQGESLTCGLPTVFVRLTGCPLRCAYCDTAYAFKGGHWHSLGEVLERVQGFATPYVTVTGGEPLAQAACWDLLQALCETGYRVSLETSGAIDLSGIDARVVKVMDLKTPGSGEESKNLYSNLAQLSAEDQIKFVICDATDYRWACGKLAEYRLAERCPVLFSAAAGTLQPRLLADWILRDRLPVRFQIQLHKVLWGDQPGR
jgi:7-carboxy-7-deazaguanine synthase